MMRAALCTVTSRWASLGVFALMMAAANSAGATSLPQDTVITATVGCHSSASDASATIRTLEAGEEIVVVERLGSWSRVDGDPSCWVSSELLEGPSRAAPGGSSSTTAQGQRSTRSALISRPILRYGPPSRGSLSPGSCPCGSGNVCIGPRGGRYCITSGGNKRYGL